MDFDTVAEKIASISRPYVKNRLEIEHRNFESDHKLKSTLTDAIEHFKKNIKDAPPTIRDIAGHIGFNIDKPPGPLRDEYVKEETKHDSGFLTSSWLQFLALTIRGSLHIRLDDNMLPIAPPNEISQAWQECTNQMIVEDNDINVILKTFVDQNLSNNKIDLPFNMVLKKDGDIFMIENQDISAIKENK